MASDAALDGLVPARGGASGSGGSAGWPGGCIRPRRPAARGWADTPSAVRHPAEDSASATARCGGSSSPAVARQPDRRDGTARRGGLGRTGSRRHRPCAVPLPWRRGSSFSTASLQLLFLSAVVGISVARAGTSRTFLPYGARVGRPIQPAR